MIKRLEGRGNTDDNLVAFKNRYANFKKQTQPLNDLFEKQGKLVNINAERTKDVVTR